MTPIGTAAVLRTVDRDRVGVARVARRVAARGRPPGRAGGVAPSGRRRSGRATDDQPGAVVEDGLDPHLGDDVGHAGQDVVGAEHGAPGGDRLGEPAAVAGGLADGVGDERGGLRHVEPQAAGPSGAGQLGAR